MSWSISRNLVTITVPAPRVSQVSSVSFQQQSDASDHCGVVSPLLGIEHRALRLEAPEIAFRLGRIASVRPPRPLAALASVGRPRPRARAAVHATAPFPLDGGRPAGQISTWRSGP